MRQWLGLPAGVDDASLRSGRGGTGIYATTTRDTTGSDGATTHRQDRDTLESEMRGSLIVIVERDGLDSDRFHKILDERELGLICHRHWKEGNTGCVWLCMSVTPINILVTVPIPVTLFSPPRPHPVNGCMYLSASSLSCLADRRIV